MTDSPADRDLAAVAATLRDAADETRAAARAGGRDARDLLLALAGTLDGLSANLARAADAIRLDTH